MISERLRTNGNEPMSERKVRVQGTTEYTGIQRCGKTTMMVHDYVDKLMWYYEPCDVYANFRIYIDGINCMDTQALVGEMLRIKREKIRHKLFLFDETGQFWIARRWNKDEQIEAVNFVWQMPKRDIMLSVCTNVGNSADVIIRDGMWITVMCDFVRAERREDDYIDFAVSWNYDAVYEDGWILPAVWRYQELFDTNEPIE